MNPVDPLDPLQPIDETTVALHAFDPSGDFAAEMAAMADRTRTLVPSCVGLSLTLLRDRLTFSFVASSADIRLLDAIQFLDGGPCEQSVAHAEVVDALIDDLEEQWTLFAAATAAFGVRSTLSLPLLDDHRVIGGINLYGASPHAFDGKHDELARLLSAWAGGAVTNADLAMTSLDEARQAPGRLDRTATVDQALGMLAETRQVSITEAQSAVREAAVRAGLDESDVAEILLDLMRPQRRHGG